MEVKYKLNLTAIVLTKNSEDVIKDCLESLQWIDEIIVVDDESTDNTREIASKFKAKVLEVKGGSFSDSRNYGMKKALGKWILYIDSDERITPALQKEIIKVISDSKTELSTWAIPRKNIILGQEMKHGGWWPDYVKRLFKKESLKKWSGELHEEPKFKGELGYLNNPIIHQKHDNLSDMVSKTNGWSEIEAKLMLDANHPRMNIFRFITAMFREFWLRMVRNTAFFDGTKGVIYAIYQVYSRFISYAKLWEMQINSS